jgi:signal peptidase II
MFLGEEHHIFGNWFIIHFTENNGMAFGLELGGGWGKLALSLFRIFAVFGIAYVLHYIIKHKYHFGLIVCV